MTFPIHRLKHNYLHDAPQAAPLSNCEEPQFVNFNNQKEKKSRATPQIYWLKQNHCETANPQLHLFQPVQGVQLEYEELELDFFYHFQLKYRRTSKY